SRVPPRPEHLDDALRPVAHVLLEDGEPPGLVQHLRQEVRYPERPVDAVEGEDAVSAFECLAIVGLRIPRQPVDDLPNGDHCRAPTDVVSRQFRRIELRRHAPRTPISRAGPWPDASVQPKTVDRPEPSARASALSPPRLSSSPSHSIRPPGGSTPGATRLGVH